jgi:hypothetical protein
MTTEKVFADGFSFKRRAGAPEFVVGNISVKVDDAVTFLQKNAKGGWVNLDILTAKSGKQYIELNQWEPDGQTQTKKQVNPVPQDDDLPF